MTPPLYPSREELDLLKAHSPDAARRRLRLYLKERSAAIKVAERLDLAKVRVEERQATLKLAGVCAGLVLAMTSLGTTVYLIEKQQDISKIAPLLAAIVLIAGVYTAPNFIDVLIKALTLFPNMLTALKAQPQNGSIQPDTSPPAPAALATMPPTSNDNTGSPPPGRKEDSE